MTKLRLYRCTFLLLLLMGCLNAFSQYQLKIICIDRDSLFNQENLGLQSSFKNRAVCTQYIYELPVLIQKKGFATASIDSIRYDSAVAFVHLYLGDTLKWSHLITKKNDAVILNAVGWDDKNFSNQPINFQQVQNVQQRVLD